MGLDTSHDAWSGAYSSFRRFRNAIAKAAGWPFDEVAQDYGLPNDRTWDQVVADMNGDKDVMGHWTTKPLDPLEFLLCHQDCDGEIEHEDIAPLLGALRPLIDKIDEEWRPKLTKFIAGLEWANAQGEALEFH